MILKLYFANTTIVMPIYWPDFDRATLEAAIREYQQRERRFGGLVAKTGS